MKRKAFTLAEILIVLAIFGMMIGIILKTYQTISQVSFRIGQDKELAKETLILSQVLDNISQTATIDYDKYAPMGLDYLYSVKGFVDTLYLTGDIWTGTMITSTGQCEASSGLYNEEYERPTEIENPCRLILKRGESGPETILLGEPENSSGEYLVSKIKFRVVPYDTSKNIISGGITEYNPGQPAFWTIGAIYSKFYNPKKRSTSSIIPIQLFFGLKGETPNIYS